MALFRAAWAAPAARSIGYYADPQQFMWFLGWVSYALGHGQSPFLSTHANYPYGVNLLWNTSVLLPGAILAPLTARLGPVVAYNALVTLALPLSGWCAYLALRRWVQSRAAAAAGGLLYGFCPYMTAQALTHPHLVVALAPPLALLLLDELLVRQRRAVLPGAALGLLAAAQLLTGEELLATLALTAVLGAMLLLLLRPRAARPRLGHAGRGLASAAAVFAVLAAYPLSVQFFGPQRAVGALHAGRPYVADLLNLIVPSRTQLIQPALLRSITNRFNASPAEQDAYLGLPLLLLLAAIVVRWRARLLVRWAGLLALVMTILALGGYLEIGGHTTGMPLPWLLVAHLPLMAQAITGRLMLYVFLLAALLLSLFLDGLRELAAWRQVAGVAVVALALLPLAPRLDYPATLKVIPPFFQGGAVERVPEGSVALVAPFAALSHGTFSSATAAMLWQASARMRFRMPEGYAFVPQPGGAGSDLRPPPSATQRLIVAIMQGRPAPRLTPSLRRRLTGELRRWHVRTVIVGPMPHGPRMIALFSALLRRPPAHVQGVYVWWRYSGAAGSAGHAPSVTEPWVGQAPTADAVRRGGAGAAWARVPPN